jgi:hypothetical protein
MGGGSRCKTTEPETARTMRDRDTHHLLWSRTPLARAAAGGRSAFGRLAERAQAHTLLARAGHDP